MSRPKHILLASSLLLSLSACLGTPATVTLKRSRQHNPLRDERVLYHEEGPEASGDQAMKDRFTTIYNTSLWGVQGGGSGSGSTKSMTVAAVSAIRLLANMYGLRSLIDAPCGEVQF